ncbi:myosin-binding protein H-like [Pteropus medius]|uniref:myosin-binding protein H-like n=1 Tax=Pteropus vampyrus TaxID=132908 RepID=UPI00196AC035|nr:myosin-binding protein H-like [Pteropus giganteus]XP_039715894.1 myosin-binding protein H-like [Pteropus giganteus]
MTGKATSEVTEEHASEPPEEPAQPSEEVTAPEAPVAAPQAPAPTGAEPAPPSEDVPSAPQLLTVQDVSDRAVTVSWEPPERLGRPGLRGYVLELRREGASEWVPVNARPAMVTQQTVRNLALGDKLFLRVAAVSLAGAGPPAVLDQLVHIREAVGKALLPAPQAPCPIDREASWGRRYPLLLTRSGCVLPPSGHKVPGPSVARGRGRSRGHAPEGSTPSLGRGLPGPQNERTRPRWEEAEGREGISTHGGQCPAVAKFLFVGALASGLPSLPPTAGPISAGGGERRS